MALPRAVKRQADEARQQIAGATAPPHEAEEAIVVAKPETRQATVTPISDTTDSIDKPSSQDTVNVMGLQQDSPTSDGFIDPNDWEARYKALRKSRGELVQGLEREIRDLRVRNEKFLQELEQLREQNRPKFEVDEKAREALGEAGAKAIEDLDRSVDDRLAVQQRERQQQAQQSREVYLSDLSSLVPQWEQINDSQQFWDWCGASDSSGFRRQDILERLDGDNDAEGVAKMFRAYLSQQGNADAQQRALPSDVALDAGTQRASSGLGAEEMMVEIWDGSEISDFWDRKSALFRSGKLKGSVAQKYEAEEDKIRTAMKEGRIDYSR